MDIFQEIFSCCDIVQKRTGQLKSIYSFHQVNYTAATRHLRFFCNDKPLPENIFTKAWLETKSR